MTTTDAKTAALIDAMKLTILSLTERCVELERQLRVARAAQGQVTCSKCGYYLPGHAIGGIDICVCDD